jgi:hypothetical protein
MREVEGSTVEKRALLIFSDLIFDSCVDPGMRSLAARQKHFRKDPRKDSQGESHAMVNSLPKEDLPTVCALERKGVNVKLLRPLASGSAELLLALGSPCIRSPCPDAVDPCSIQFQFLAYRRNKSREWAAEPVSVLT